MTATVGIAGAGTMGAGIAIVCARAGMRTILYDKDEATLARAERQTKEFFGKSVERGKLTVVQVEAALSALTRVTRIEDLRSAQFVIEAVFEDLQTKLDVLSALDKVCPATTIFASNTSTLSITELGAGSGRPDRMVGMHFCLPAQLMQLVELSPGLATSEQTFSSAWALCEALGQRPVKTKDQPGFILNDLLIPFNNDAIRLVEAGVADPADIDVAIKKGLGYAMGPCELLDLVGLDTQLRLCEALYAVTHDPRAAAPPLLRRMVAAGLLGRKSGRGFYTYERNAMFGA